MSCPFPPQDINLRAITKFESGRHCTLHAAMVVLNDRWLLIYRDASKHAVDTTSKIVVAESFDRGHTFGPVVTIYNESGMDAHNLQACLMADGQVGVLAARQTSAARHHPVFIKRDAMGSWSSQILSGQNHPTSWTGGSLQISRYPSCVGGHDETGFIAYSANHTDPGNKVQYLRTLDNGATWDSGVATGPISGVRQATVNVTRLGDSDRWVMMVRDDVLDTNAIAFKSTDMINWTGPFDTGQRLNANPSNILYWEGDIYWLACSRKVALGKPVGPIDDGLIHQWADAESLWCSDFQDGWPGWSVLARVYSTEGHPIFFMDECGKPYFTFGFNRLLDLDDSTVVGLIGVEDYALSGANEHGHWQRWPDGTQRCWMKNAASVDITLSNGSGFRSLSEQVDLPAPFFCGEYVVSASSGYSNLVMASGTPDPDRHVSKIRLRGNAFAKQSTAPLGYEAIGLWK